MTVWFHSGFKLFCMYLVLRLYSALDLNKGAKHYISDLLFLSALIQKKPKTPTNQKPEKEKSCIFHFCSNSGLREDNESLWDVFFGMLLQDSLLKHLLTLQQACSALNHFKIKHQSAYAHRALSSH